VIDHLTSVDPGKWAGRAEWEGGRLHDCGKWERHWVRYGNELVIEQPRAYPIGKSRARPNDIIQLALTAGQISEHYRPVTWIPPHAWKGQVPDEILYDRIRKRLDKREADLLDLVLKGIAKGYHHNVLDAIGIGLFHLGRAGRGMVPR
jgi:hypothetical protein